MMGIGSIKKPKKKGVAKVPVILQMEALECGAACLDMILAYYEKWIPLSTIRQDCGVSRDGSKAKNILVAARHYGLKASGYTCDPEILKAEVSFPCIIHWNFNHFVVLRGFKGNKAYINDPGMGDYKVSMEEFDESFTGIVLVFEPGEDFIPSGHPKSLREFVKKRLYGLGAAIAFVTLVTVISSFTSIIEPIFNRAFFDRLLSGNDPEWIKPFLISLLVLYFIEIIAQILDSVTRCKINGKMAITGTFSFMWKVLHLPMNFFSQRMSGDILSRQTANVEVSNVFVTTFAPICLNAIMMLFYLIVMIRYSPILTLVGVAAVVIDSFITFFITKKKVNVMRVGARDAGKLAANTTAGINMIETIKTSGAEEGYFAQWAGYDANYSNHLIMINNLNDYMITIPSLIITLSGILVVSLGVYYILIGDFSMGMVAGFQGLMLTFMKPAHDMINGSQTIMEMKSEMERIEDVMEAEDDDIMPESEGFDGEFDKLKGNIELKNVVFGYSPLEEPLINGLNISIKRGSRVAFVGTSGSGKSTVAKLISALYKPWSGEITFDGKPLSEIDKRTFRSSVAVVNQDIVMFDDTVANNIKLFDDSIEDYEMIMAARDAHIHNDLMERPEGYNLRLVQGGSNLSGGQRQRIEIARVLAQDPTIIIMDEATSALDAKTEYEVVNSIRDRGITCIVVAHRLSTIRDCDEIVVLDHGKIVEHGTHQELFAMDGKYKSLVVNE